MYLLAIAETMASDYEKIGAIINSCLAAGMAERLRQIKPQIKYDLDINPEEW